jgi:hypothetical protein
MDSFEPCTRVEDVQVISCPLQARARFSTSGGLRRIRVRRERRWPNFIIWRWAGPALDGWIRCPWSQPLLPHPLPQHPPPLPRPARPRRLHPGLARQRRRLRAPPKRRENLPRRRRRGPPRSQPRRLPRRGPEKLPERRLGVRRGKGQRSLLGVPRGSAVAGKALRRPGSAPCRGALFLFTFNSSFPHHRSCLLGSSALPGSCC